MAKNRNKQLAATHLNLKKIRAQYDFNSQIIPQMQERMSQVVQQQQDQQENALLLLPSPNKLAAPQTILTNLKTEITQKQQLQDVLESITSLEQAIKIYQKKELDPTLFKFIASLVQQQLQPQIDQVNQANKAIKLDLNIDLQNSILEFIIIDPYQYLYLSSKQPDYQKLLDVTNQENQKRIDFVIDDLQFKLTTEHLQLQTQKLDQQFAALQQQFGIALQDYKRRYANIKSFSSSVYQVTNPLRLNKRVKALDTATTNVFNLVTQMQAVSSQSEALKQNQKDLKNKKSTLLPEVERISQVVSSLL